MENKYGKITGWFGFVLTMVKPIFGIAVVYLVATNSSKTAAVGIFIIVVADIFDGVMFRASSLADNYRLGRIRRVADVIGDRLVVQAVLIAMVFFTDLPVRFYLIATARELGIAGIVGYSQLTKNPIKEPNMASRVAVACQAAMAICWLTAGFTASLVAIALLVGFGLIGGWQYSQVLRKAPEPQLA